MWLISTQGEGSLFCFSIPFTRPADLSLQRSPPQKNPAPHPHKIDLTGQEPALHRQKIDLTGQEPAPPDRI
jgi:hypothetical protein